MDGFGRCYVCGSPLTWNSDFMKSEIYGEELNDDDDAIVRNLSCGHCGASYEVCETSENDKKNYPFWKEKTIYEGK